MKRSIISIPVIVVWIMAFLMMTSFKTIPSTSVSKKAPSDKVEAITIFATSPTAIGSTYYGPVTVSGAINASGTYAMPALQHGMALHCVFMLSLPNGTITIQLNCNLVTSNGVWKILGGTEAYQNLKGGGSLNMPNDTDEVLQGTVRGL